MCVLLVFSFDMVTAADSLTYFCVHEQHNLKMMLNNNAF